MGLGLPLGLALLAGLFLVGVFLIINVVIQVNRKSQHSKYMWGAKKDIILAVFLLLPLTVIAFMTVYNYCDNIRYKESLIYQVSVRNYAGVLQLLKEGVSPDDGNSKNNYTPLMYMAVNEINEVEIASLLIQYGANVNAQYRGNKKGDDQGYTALLDACMTENNMELIVLLLDNGAEINHAAEDGTTALMIASQYEAVDVVRLLLARGANLSLKNKAGQTAWDLAESKEIQQILTIKSMAEGYYDNY